MHLQEHDDAGVAAASGGLSASHGAGATAEAPRCGVSQGAGSRAACREKLAGTAVPHQRQWLPPMQCVAEQHSWHRSDLGSPAAGRAAPGWSSPSKRTTWTGCGLRRRQCTSSWTHALRRRCSRKLDWLTEGLVNIGGSVGVAGMSIWRKDGMSGSLGGGCRRCLWFRTCHHFWEKSLVATIERVCPSSAVRTMIAQPQHGFRWASDATKYAGNSHLAGRSSPGITSDVNRSQQCAAWYLLLHSMRCCTSAR